MKEVYNDMISRIGFMVQDFDKQYVPYVFHNKNNSDLFLTNEEIKKIIKIYEDSDKNPAIVKSGFKKNIRKVSKVELNRNDFHNIGIYEKILRAVYATNRDFYQFNINGLVENLEILKYDSSIKAVYKKHIDYGGGVWPRKISIVVQLSNSEDYEGGNTMIYIGDEPIKLDKTIGCINLFPSYQLHEVTPITKGVRYALVGWVSGPHWV